MKRSIPVLLILFLCCSLQHVIAQSIDSLQAVQYGKPFKKVPDRRDAAIYQVNIRSFSQSGDLKGIMPRLDSIQALGVNIIYLLPIYPVGMVKSSNSPYCVRDYKAVNPEFGTLEDLRALVDGAHKRGMAVMLDWVANHTSWDNPWIKNKGWYMTDSVGKIISPPGFHWNDVAQLNFKNADMRRAMIGSMKYWVLSANVDGFRCDYADGPPADFWKQAIDSLRNTTGHKLLFLAEGNRKDLFADGFDFNFGFTFYGNLKRVFGKSKPVSSIDSIDKVEYKYASGDQQMARYLTNHDVNSSDGTPQQLFGDDDGSTAAFVIVAYMHSIPFIYNGQEIGYRKRLIFPFTKTKIEWTPHYYVTEQYKKIIAFRNKSKAIRWGTLTAFSNADVCAFTKQYEKEKVLVLTNLRDKPVSFTLPADVPGLKWKDAFTGQKTPLSNVIELKPYSYLVYKQ